MDIDKLLIILLAVGQLCLVLSNMLLSARIKHMEEFPQFLLDTLKEIYDGNKE